MLLSCSIAAVRFGVLCRRPDIRYVDVCDFEAAQLASFVRRLCWENYRMMCCTLEMLLRLHDCASCCPNVVASVGVYSSFVDVYNAKSNTWTRDPKGLGQARGHLAAASLPSGLVFFAGGQTSGILFMRSLQIPKCILRLFIRQQLICPAICITCCCVCVKRLEVG